jgi:hypothetical protein
VKSAYTLSQLSDKLSNLSKIWSAVWSLLADWPVSASYNVRLFKRCTIVNIQQQELIFLVKTWRLK